MKKEIATLFLMTSVWAAQAQGTFTIEGQVKNVEDGALITLFRLDGNVGSSIGVDTIRNGHFRFQAETLGNETEIVDMMGRSDKFPSMNISAILCCSVHIAGSMQEVRWMKKDRRYVHKLIVYGSWKMKLRSVLMPTL